MDKPSVLAVLVVLLSLVDARRRCRCSSATHPQQFFCRSDFFFRGRLLAGPKHEALPEPKRPKSSFRVWATERRVLKYVFQVDEILKGRSKDGKDGRIIGKGKKEKTRQSSFKVKVYTDPYTCTVKLFKKIPFAVGGYIDEGRMFVSECNWISPWNTLTKSQKYGFRRFYGENCQCHSSACSSLDPYGELLDRYCSQKHMYCGKEGLFCTWKHVYQNSIPYTRCVFMNMLGYYFNFAQFQS